MSNILEAAGLALLTAAAAVLFGLGVALAVGGVALLVAGLSVDGLKVRVRVERVKAEEEASNGQARPRAA